MTVREVLAGAYHLLDDKSRWTQGAAARDKDGNKLFETASLFRPHAVQFCALGAIMRTIGSSDGVLFNQAQTELARELGPEPVNPAVANHRVATHNDGPNGYETIRGAFERALARLATEEEELAVAPEAELVAV